MTEYEPGSSQESEQVPETPGFIPPFVSTCSSSESEQSEASCDKPQMCQKLLFNFLTSIGIEKPHILSKVIFKQTGVSDPDQSIHWNINVV